MGCATPGWWWSRSFRRRVAAAVGGVVVAEAVASGRRNGRVGGHGGLTAARGEGKGRHDDRLRPSRRRRGARGRRGGIGGSRQGLHLPSSMNAGVGLGANWPTTAGRAGRGLSKHPIRPLRGVGVGRGEGHVSHASTSVEGRGADPLGGPAGEDRPARERPSSASSKPRSRAAAYWCGEPVAEEQRVVGPERHRYAGLDDLGERHLLGPCRRRRGRRCSRGTPRAPTPASATASSTCGVLDGAHPWPIRSGSRYSRVSMTA